MHGTLLSISLPSSKYIWHFSAFQVGDLVLFLDDSLFFLICEFNHVLLFFSFVLPYESHVSHSLQKAWNQELEKIQLILLFSARKMFQIYMFVIVFSWELSFLILKFFVAQQFFLKPCN